MLIKNINLLQNLIVVGLLTLVSGDCTKQVFFLENSAYQPQKGDTRIRNPGYYWKHNVIFNGYGDEIFEKLDESKYEYMFHAYHPQFGLEVYRICEKNSEYTKYGKVEYSLPRGYLLHINNMMDLDSFLYRFKFNIKRISQSVVEKYIEEQKLKRKLKYEKEHPYMHQLNTIVNDTLTFLMCLLFTAPFIYIISYAFREENKSNK